MVFYLLDSFFVLPTSMIAALVVIGIVVFISIATDNRKQNNKEKRNMDHYKHWQQEMLKEEETIKREADEARKSKHSKMTEEKMPDVTVVYYIGLVFCDDDAYNRAVLKFVDCSYRVSVMNRSVLIYSYNCHERSLTGKTTSRKEEIRMSISQFNKTWFTSKALAREKVLELIKKGDCPFLNTEPISLPRDLF